MNEQKHVSFSEIPPLVKQYSDDFLDDRRDNTVTAHENFLARLELKEEQRQEKRRLREEQRQATIRREAAEYEARKEEQRQATIRREAAEYEARREEQRQATIRKEAARQAALNKSKCIPGQSCSIMGGKKSKRRIRRTRRRTRRTRRTRRK